MNLTLAQKIMIGLAVGALVGAFSALAEHHVTNYYKQVNAARKDTVL